MRFHFSYLYTTVLGIVLCCQAPTASAQSSYLTVNPGCSLTVNNAAISVGGKIISNQNFDLHAGTLILNASGYDQLIRGDLFSKRTIKNLVIANEKEVKIEPVNDDTLKISHNLSFGTPTSRLNTGDRLTLLSSNEYTANLGEVGAGNVITGKTTVERHINIGTGPGQHTKSWQFLTAPVTGPSVYDSWMEGGIVTLNPIGYGVSVTGSLGSAGGFDVYSALPSMKTFSDQSKNWVGIGSPHSTPVNNPYGFMIFVRGDRSVFNFSGNNSKPVPTVLRASGNLITGQTNPIYIKKQRLRSIANPYASLVDFERISKTGGIDERFYVWDPALHGTYGLGGYQTISKVNGWKPVPGGTNVYSAAYPQKNLQSGQAFFVYATSGAERESLFFTEEAKTSEEPPKNFARPMGPPSEKISFLKIDLFTGPNIKDILADGNLVVFDDHFSDYYDRNDAIKSMNEGENFSLQREGKLLSIEARTHIKSQDTLFYEIKNLKSRLYQLRIYPEHMLTNNLNAYWVDNFLQTETLLSLNDSSVIDFNTSSGAGSNAANRFMIIFRPAIVLSVDFLSFTAAVQKSDVTLRWTIENENNLKYYSLERSSDGKTFAEISKVFAKNKPSYHYNYIDYDIPPGIYFYKIKSVAGDGSFTYSKVAHARVSREVKNKIRPNPIKGNEINIFVDYAAGDYQVRLFNAAGMLIHQQGFKSATGRLRVKLRQLPKGIYQLELTGPGNEIEVLNLVK